MSVYIACVISTEWKYCMSSIVLYSFWLQLNNAEKITNKCMVNVLKVWTLVAGQKCLDKQCRSRSDCFWRSSLIRIFTVCYSDKYLVNWSLGNQLLLEKRKRKKFQILEHLPNLDLLYVYCSRRRMWDSYDWL